MLKTLLPSNWAARLFGPNTRRPWPWKTSTMPAHSGPSGPTTVRSIFCARANAANGSISIAGMGTHSAKAAMPALPGAQKSLVTRGLWAIFHASACSRPPLPMIRILIARSGVTVGEAFRDGQSQKPRPVAARNPVDCRALLDRTDIQVCAGIVGAPQGHLGFPGLEHSPQRAADRVEPGGAVDGRVKLTV